MKLNCIEKIAIKMRDTGEGGLAAEINKVADLEQTDRDGRTLLINAAFYGREDIVNQLLSYRVNVNAADRNGFTALHAAVQENYQDIAKMLLEHGADVNARNDWGNTPIWLASPDLPKEFFNLLLDYGADPSARNNFGVSAIDRMSAYPEILHIFDRHR